MLSLLDRGGSPFHRKDGRGSVPIHPSGRLSAEAILPARSGCIPTGDLIPYVADGGDLTGMNTCDRHLTLVPGGIPLVVDGTVVGAIGVGGGSKEQDLEIANHVVSVFNSMQR